MNIWYANILRISPLFLLQYWSRSARGGDTWPPRAPAAGYITATGPLQCCSAAELHRPATDLAAMLDNTTASLFVKRIF